MVLDAGGVGGSGFGGGVDAVGDGGEQLVGVLLFFEDAFEGVGGSVLTEEFGPAAQGAVDGDFMMLDLLGGGDESDVADAWFGSIFDVVLGFGDEGGDGFAGAGAGIAGGIAEEALHFGNMALGFGEVVAEGGGEA